MACRNEAPEQVRVSTAHGRGLTPVQPACRMHDLQTFTYVNVSFTFVAPEVKVALCFR